MVYICLSIHFYLLKIKFNQEAVLKVLLEYCFYICSPLCVLDTNDLDELRCLSSPPIF